VKQSTKDTVVLTQFYQRLFVLAVLGGWLIEMIDIIHGLMGAYTSVGTWTFQITSWLFPAALFVLSLAYVAHTYDDWSRRLFSATLLSVVAMSVYQAVSLIEEDWYYHSYTAGHPVNGNSDWASFGNDWIMMGVGLLLYAILLFWIRRKKFDGR
jgi:hypothetical protein